ncbi:dihydrofolate reductase [Sphingorhabdus sp. M41]|uniref:dihydrofolate reductase n=1 Tax=Sphingorhabdus sp. M41 TaxID=1806885 RepID=UPI00078C5FA6|nr:dihydrofolate reductase [Sphingorhabdus sp. M41]AMO71076.1 diacylglycerol kinase [Sphingorhabdus sp. M41]
MNHPEIIFFLAIADNGVIGDGDTIPWHLPEDQRRFKQMTMGKPMIMGRKTFDSLPGMLPGRRHIVLTRDENWEGDGAEVASSIAEALKMANAPHIAVIGGAEIYKAFLDKADRIELTEVHSEPAGDIKMPAFDAAIWEETAREDREAKNGKPGYSFVTLKRRLP